MIAKNWENKHEGKSKNDYNNHNNWYYYLILLIILFDFSRKARFKL